MIRTRASQGLQSIALARGEKGNALNAELVAALSQAFSAAQADPEARLVALSADGASFSTGFDLSDMDTCSEAVLVDRFIRVELLLAQVWASHTPVIAFAHGRTWGAGADLFCAAGDRWAKADATFRFPGAQFGLVLGTRRLAARVGRDVARRWVETGATIGADEALAAGLVGRIGTEDEFWNFAGSRPMRLDAPTRSAVYGASDSQHDLDGDLASLVRSLMRPGLKLRIDAYRRPTE
jgi:enoyl-CoA hydratase/carnithine racemase